MILFKLINYPIKVIIKLTIPRPQYKELLKDYLRNSPKELHKDIIKKFKDDKMQKMISLNDQYTKSIADHLEREQVSSCCLMGEIVKQVKWFFKRWGSDRSEFSSELGLREI